MAGDEEVDAGEFGAWLSATRRTIRSEGEADVPCGTCTGCCRASQFVHIAPDEHDTLARIPRSLLFLAPGLPRGHVLMGYDQDGCCPMLTDAGCSIYDHRPRTCRTYDCRIFAATGIDVAAGDSTKEPVAERARRWRFRYDDDAARRAHDRLRRRAADEAADGQSATARAVAAIVDNRPSR